VSLLGVFAAAIAAWGFGAAYYGALGKIWLDAVGFRPEERARIEGREKGDITPFILSFIAELLMAVVMSSMMSQLPPPSLVKGAALGITIWLGFVAAPMIVNNAYAMRSLRLTALDAGHWLGVLILMGAIIGGIG
jgi:Protein of unknown function (DUF1761)